MHLKDNLSEMAYERDSVEDIVKRIKPILANHPQLKTLEDPDQYLIDLLQNVKNFLIKMKLLLIKINLLIMLVLHHMTSISTFNLTNIYIPQHDKIN